MGTLRYSKRQMLSAPFSGTFPTTIFGTFSDKTRQIAENLRTHWIIICTPHDLSCAKSNEPQETELTYPLVESERKNNRLGIKPSDYYVRWVFLFSSHLSLKLMSCLPRSCTLLGCSWNRIERSGGPLFPFAFTHKTNIRQQIVQRCMCYQQMNARIDGIAYEIESPSTRTLPVRTYLVHPPDDAIPLRPPPPPPAPFYLVCGMGLPSGFVGSVAFLDNRRTSRRHDKGDREVRHVSIMPFTAVHYRSRSSSRWTSMCNNLLRVDAQNEDLQLL